MTRWLLRTGLPVVVALVLGIGGTLTVARHLGLLTPFATDKQSHDSQVIYAVERTEQVSLLSLGVQGIREQDATTKFLGKDIPGTGRTVFVQYDFHAKLGLDGSQVSVSKTSAHHFLLTVPHFIFIGYDQPTFKLATEDNGILSVATPDIDKVQMIDDILDGDAREKYVSSNTDLLQAQTKAFYDSLITGIDPDAVVSFQFRS